MATVVKRLVPTSPVQDYRVFCCVLGGLTLDVQRTVPRLLMPLVFGSGVAIDLWSLQCGRIVQVANMLRMVVSWEVTDAPAHGLNSTSPLPPSHDFSTIPRLPTSADIFCRWLASDPKSAALTRQSRLRVWCLLCLESLMLPCVLPLWLLLPPTIHRRSCVLSPSRDRSCFGSCWLFAFLACVLL